MNQSRTELVMLLSAERNLDKKFAFIEEMKEALDQVGKVLIEHLIPLWRIVASHFGSRFPYNRNIWP